MSRRKTSPAAELPNPTHQWRRGRVSIYCWEKDVFDVWLASKDWNGWACPFFTHAQCERIQTLLAEQNARVTGPDRKDCEQLRFDEGTGKWILELPNVRRYNRKAGARVAKVVETYEPTIIDGVKTYSVGGCRWTWQKEDEAEDLPPPHVHEARIALASGCMGEQNFLAWVHTTWNGFAEPYLSDEQCHALRQIFAKENKDIPPSQHTTLDYDPERRVWVLHSMVDGESKEDCPRVTIAGKAYYAVGHGGSCCWDLVE